MRAYSGGDGVSGVFKELLWWPERSEVPRHKHRLAADVNHCRCEVTCCELLLQRCLPGGSIGQQLLVLAAVKLAKRETLSRMTSWGISLR